MPRHNSLNLREVVMLPIKIMKAHCPHAETNRAPSLRLVRHYPHLLDIDTGPRIEWDLTHLKRVLPGTQYGLLRPKNSKRLKSAHKFIQKWRPVVCAVPKKMTITVMTTVIGHCITDKKAMHVL